MTLGEQLSSRDQQLAKALKQLKNSFGPEPEEIKGEDIPWDDDFSPSLPERVQACGLMAWHLDEQSGRLYRTVHLCEDYRRCLKCRKRKAKKLKGSIAQNLNTDKVKITVVKEDEAKKLVRKLRDNEEPYQRIPRPDDKVAIIQDGDDMDVDSLPIEDWLVEVPEGKRVVGGGKKGIKKTEEPPKEEQEFEEYDTFTISTIASEYEIKQCFEEAAKETPCPKTSADIPQCVNERMMKARELLRDRNYVVYSVYKRGRYEKGLIPKWT